MAHVQTGKQKQVGLIADGYKKMFDDSKEMWACTSKTTSLDYIINNALTMGYVKSVCLVVAMPHIQFTDGSLLIFKKGSHVVKGYYAQTQDCFC